MGLKHLIWARGHDWGRQAFLKEGKILVPANGVDPAEPYGVSRGAWIEFSSFTKLKHWAGY